MTPARASDWSRVESSAGEIRGTPRRRELKVRLPSRSSLTTSIVQRSSRSSIALATGQNWPYLLTDVLPWRDREPSSPKATATKAMRSVQKLYQPATYLEPD